MKKTVALLAVLALTVGCAGGGEEVGTPETEEAAGPAIKLQVEEPEPLTTPEYQTPESDTDWAAKANNKNIEIIQVLNIINPVAAYISEGFNQYGDRFDATLQEEWVDTQAQLGSALGLYDSCKARMETGDFDKQLFLDLEGVWQMLVKTGVAGVRTKSMVDSALQDIAG
jgi:hypothetical protein